MDADAPARRLPTFRALRHRNYRLYFFGQLVSFTGSWMQTTALQWLTYQLTGRSQWTALIATASILPAFLLGTWGGVLADRFPRRGLILVTQALLMAQALLLAGLVFLGQPTPEVLLAIALASGLVNALDLPARLAFVMELVGREDVVNAVALNSLMFNAARVIGPWLGGLVLNEFGAGVCFLANGLSFVTVLGGLALMDVPRALPRVAPAGFRGLFGGWRHLAERPPVGALVLLTGLMSLFGWPFLALLPALAHRGLGGEVEVAELPVSQQGEEYSRLLTGMGCGALLAALTLASFSAPPWRRRFLAVSVVAASTGLVALSLVRDPFAAVASCACVGFGLVLFNATSQSVVQLSTDEHNRGQVMGVWSMVISGALPLGNQIFGPAADHWGVPEVLRVQGLACLVAGLLVLGALAFIRRRPTT